MSRMILTENEFHLSFPLPFQKKHVPGYIADVEFIIAHTYNWITTGKSRIIVSLGLYSYETNYRDSVRCCSESLHSASSH
jgi:hypothetical protein